MQCCDPSFARGRVEEAHRVQMRVDSLLNAKNVGRNGGSSVEQVFVGEAEPFCPARNFIEDAREFQSMRAIVSARGRRRVAARYEDSALVLGCDVRCRVGMGFPNDDCCFIDTMPEDVANIGSRSTGTAYPSVDGERDNPVAIRILG